MPCVSSKSDRKIVLGATQSQWNTFADDVGCLWCPPSKEQVPRLAHPPTPLEFSRDYVGPSRPCIIQNAILDKKEGSTTPLVVTLDDICDRLLTPTTPLTVDVTPDGYGDCVRTLVADDEKEVFVQPKEVVMTLQEFRERLRQQEYREFDRTASSDIYGRPTVHPLANNKISSNQNETEVPCKIPDDSIVYYSRQNDCLRTEVSNRSKGLQDLFPSSIDWAQEVFQTNLEAVNLWIGNSASVSSMHKDHYENLFYVASGEKIFTVCPPSDVPCLYEHCDYPRASFEVQEEDGTWKVRTSNAGDDDKERVHWIAPDVSQSTTPELLERHPLLRQAHVLEIRVSAGEMLYLPSLWFHRVTQSCETIGVNYWYDMKFDSPLWCYFSFLQQLQHGEPQNATLQDENSKEKITIEEELND